MLRQDDFKHHISEQFNVELESIKSNLLKMGGRVEQQLNGALEALLNMDSGDAELIIAGDYEVNQLELSIDDECSSVLALRQPTAGDLRLVLAATKINTDLERIGDEAAKVARQAVRLSEEGMSPSNFVEVRHIGKHVSSMLRKSLDAFARFDIELAIEVVKEDNSVDEEYGSAMRSLVTFMMEDPRDIGAILNEMWALRSLERIGDHACNISEHLIYLVRGLDIRHGGLQEISSEIRKDSP